MTTERDHIETAARLLDGDDHAMNDQMHGQPADMSDKTDLTAAIAAFRSGNAPHILQVFEEISCSVNTTAAGGNAALLAG